MDSFIVYVRHQVCVQGIRGSEVHTFATIRCYEFLEWVGGRDYLFQFTDVIHYKQFEVELIDSWQDAGIDNGGNICRELASVLISYLGFKVAGRSRWMPCSSTCSCWSS